MKISKQQIAKLQKLEESLWISKTRFDKEYMEHTLHPDFFEFGRSGLIHKRADTLAEPAQEIKVRLPLKKLKVHSISNNTVLITYVSIVTYKDNEAEIGNRSSLWIKTPTGWQLRFHQGTSVKN